MKSLVSTAGNKVGGGQGGWWGDKGSETQNVTLTTPLLHQGCIYLNHSSPKTDGKNN